MPRAPSLVALAAASAALVAGCGGSDDASPAPAATAAPPQRVELGWSERHEAEGQRIDFRVAVLEVTEDGWRARVSLTNGTETRYAIGEPQSTAGLSFGLMLFRTGDLRELEQRNQSNDLPGLRRARSYDPSLPDVLEPGRSWSGTISAPGSLAAGLFVRVVFGTLVPLDESPPGFPERLVWITDNAYRLRGASR